MGGSFKGRSTPGSRAKGARGGRFAGGGLAPIAQKVNASIGFDWRLLPHDVAGSIAHATMLANVGLVSEADREAIVRGLRAVEGQLEGTRDRAMDPALEDVHMNVEARLTASIGEAGARLHTGRSRNDQVATDLRLYARASADRIIEAIDRLRRTLIEVAEGHVDTVMPGYTHLQRAQPVRLAHHLLAYHEMLRRDRGRIGDARDRADQCPLGAGALAATPLPIDRADVCRQLGFSEPTRNSLDTVGDRDFAIELVAAAALTQSHLSRLGEELVLWMSQEFGFARLSERYCSGSSLMPQKVNPDLAELIRGKSGRVTGAWVALMTVVKGLPLAYNKDLQETQEPLFDAVETVVSSLEVADGMMRNIEFDRVRLRQAVDRGYLVATEVADYLVGRGLAFRQAHDVAGAVVRQAIGRGVELSELTLDEFRGHSTLFDRSIYRWIDPARVVDRRTVVGGPARSAVTAALAEARRSLESP